MALREAVTWMRFRKNREVPSSQIRLRKHNDTNVLKTHTQTFKRRRKKKKFPQGPNLQQKIQKEKKKPKSKQVDRMKSSRIVAHPVPGVMISVIPSAGSCFSLLAASTDLRAGAGEWPQTGWDSCPSVLAWLILLGHRTLQNIQF